MDFEMNPYVSCIQMNKQSIIPPLMTVERRAEMRYYREIAITLEKHFQLRKMKRSNIDSGIITCGSDESLDETARSEVEFDVNESSSFTEACTEEVDFSSRTRRDSYTLEAPSPIMLEYMKANEKYDELLIDMMDSSDCSTVVDAEIPISTPVEGFSPGEIKMSTKKLTLQDLEKEPEQERNSSNLYESSSVCKNLEQFIAMVERTKAFSLPNTSHSTPVCLPAMSASSCCLKVDYEKPKVNELVTIGSNDTSFENQDKAIEIRDMELETSLDARDHSFMNDSFNKYVILLDSNNSANILSEPEPCGQESMYSDCSSVSLSKFLGDIKISENQETTALNNYLSIKEQLELKHRNELMKLLREQQKENNLLDQLIRSPDTSSPKSNYAYSKDVVLKKYNAENDPSPILPERSPESNTIQRPSRMNCRRRICDDEPRETNDEKSCETPVIAMPDATSKTEGIQDFETRVRAATKINAAVRGYFVRRLFKTCRVQILLQTINDCLITAISLQKESDLQPAELTLQGRVLQQSITAQNELLEIFAFPIKEQLEIIAVDRELKNRSLSKKNKTPLPLSEATQKTIERRKSLNSDPKTQENFVRKRCKSTSSIRFGTITKSQNAVKTNNKTRTKPAQNYPVPRCTRNSWR